MEEDKVTEALDFLESEGFYIKNLWHVQDVQSKFKCTEEEAFEVLENAVSGEWIMEQINERIEYYGEQDGLEEKEEE